MKNNQRALATISGFIDGISNFGSAIGQILIGYVVTSGGWQATFLMLSVFNFLSAFPVVYFVYQEVKQWREKKRE